jgi:hypothetical protein
MRNTLLRVCLSTTTKAACTTIMRCGSKGWPPMPPSANTNTTAPARHVPRESREQCRRPPQATDHGPRSRSWCHQRPARRLRLAHHDLWHVGADLVRPASPSGPGILTAGGGSGCWSRSLGSRGLRAILRVKDCGSGGPQPGDGLQDKEAGAENQNSSSGMNGSLEAGSPIQVGWQAISVRLGQQQPVYTPGRHPVGQNWQPRDCRCTVDLLIVDDIFCPCPLCLAEQFPHQGSSQGGTLLSCCHSPGIQIVLSHEQKGAFQISGLHRCRQWG